MHNYLGAAEGTPYDHKGFFSTEAYETIFVSQGTEG